MLSKLETLLWYLSKPQLYTHLVYQLYQYFFPHRKENSRPESTKWCNSKFVNTEDAILKITGSKTRSLLHELYKDEITKAHNVADTTPIQMGGAGDIDLLFQLVKYIKPQVVIETGVAYGWSSLAILLALKELQQGKLYSTDIPYAKMNNEDFVGIVVPNNLRSRWTLLRTPDNKGLKWILKKESLIDIVHYDSDKSYRGRTRSYRLLWHHLRKGGLLISDDINDNLGFKDFAENVNVEPVIVYHPEDDKFIGILIKP